MRRFPQSWMSTIGKLGFRRRRKKLAGGRRRVHHRRPTFECMEARHLLSITVNTLVDENDGANVGGISLRDALNQAYGQTGPVEIKFDPALSGGTIALTHGELFINSDVNIIGPGADLLTVDAQQNSRVIQVGNADVTIRGLTITGGLVTGAADGGGIESWGDLTLDSVVVTDNHAGDWGGGIYVWTNGWLKLNNSTVHSNSAGSYGGAIAGELASGERLHISGSTIWNNTAANGAGLMYKGTLPTSTATIMNSTFSDNSASEAAGMRIGGSGHVTIVNSTITDNHATAGQGGGIMLVESSNITLHSNILAGNTANWGFHDIVDWSAGVVTSDSSNNLIRDVGNSGLVDGGPTHNIVIGASVDPGLAPLADNGGPTKTHALLSSSRAIDAGNNAKATYNGQTLARDQRGLARFIHPEATYPNGDTVDIGAFELGAFKDFDGDGRDDHVAFDSATNNVTIYLGASQLTTGSIWGQLPTGQWSTIRVGDFNGDGRDDLAARTADGVTCFAISESTRFNIFPSGGVGVNSNWTKTFVGDFDGNGSQELLGWNPAIGPPVTAGTWQTISYDDRSGAKFTFNWGTALQDFVDAGATLHVGDADRDGRDDLVVRDPSTSNWFVGRSKDIGSGTFAQENWQNWFAPYAYQQGKLVDIDAPYAKLVEIFSDVYNTIETEFYPGLMKGPTATAETEAGNSWDQATLLTERLDAAGFQAQIVTGKRRVTESDTLAWLGAKDLEAAKGILWSAIDKDAVHDANKDTFTFQHAWTAVQAPGPFGFYYTFLDPSWKFRNFQPGVALGPNNGSGLLTSFDTFAKQFLFTKGGDDKFVKKQLPIEAYEDQVMNHLTSTPAHAGKSLADVPYDAPIINRQFKQLPVTDGYPLGTADKIGLLYDGDNWTENFNTLASPNSERAEKWAHRVKIKITTSAPGFFEQTLSVPFSGLDAIKISYTNGTPGMVIPQLSIGSQNFAPMTAVPTNSEVTIEITHLDPSNYAALLGSLYQHKDTYTRKAGQIVVVSLDANQYSSGRIAQMQADVNAAMATIGADDIDDVVAYVGAKYWYNFNRDSGILTGLTQTVDGQNRVGSGIITADSTFNAAVNIQPHLDMPLVPDGLFVDLKNGVMSPLRLSPLAGAGTDLDTLRFALFNGSALENAILEEVINASSVSTVKGIQLYLDSGQSQSNVRGLVVEKNMNDAAPEFKVTAKYDGTGFHDNLSEVLTEAQLRGILLDSFEQTVINKLNTANALNRLWVPTGNVNISPSGGGPGWDGTVFVHEKFGTNDISLSYAIQRTGDPESQGAYRYDSVAPPNPDLQPGTFVNQTFAGDPVNVANGNMFRDDLDFKFANPIIPLDFARHYDSQNKLDVGFGVGWVHSFTGFVYQEQDPANANDQDFVWIRGNGERHIFEDATYTVPNSLFGERITNSAGLTEFRDKDGTRYVFTPIANGIADPTTGKQVYARLTSIQNAAGDQGVNIFYVGDSVRVDRVESRSMPGATGRYLQFEYNADTTIARVKRVEGGQTHSTWEYVVSTLAALPTANKKRLTLVKHAGQAGVETKYEYFTTGPDAQKGLMKSTIEPNGESHSYEYYANGRAFRVTDGEGHQQSFSYNLFRNLTEFTDERGNVETYIHQDNGLLTKQIHADRSRLEFSWGIENSAEEFLMKSSTDEVGGKETFFYYQPSDLHTYRTGAQQQYQNLYRPGELRQSISKDDVVTEYQYWLSNIAPLHYISLLSKVIVSPGQSNITTEYKRDTVGNLVQVVDAAGNATDYEYFGSSSPAHLHGLRKSQTQPKGVSGTEAVEWKPIVDNFDVTGEKLSVRLLTGNIIERRVVADAIRIDRIDADGVLTTKIVDNYSNIDGTEPNFRFAPLGPQGTGYWESTAVVGEYGGDALVLNKPSAGQGSATWIFTDLLPGKYRISATWISSTDRDGAVYQVFQGLPDGVAELTTAAVDQTQPPSGFRNYQTVFEYDTAGNTVAAITEGLPAGRRSYDSHGNVIYDEDAAGVATAFTYDVLGRLVRSAGVTPREIDFAIGPVSPYNLYGVGTNEADPPTWSVQNNGSTLKIFGNNRLAVPLNYTITPNTILELDLDVTTAGDWYGISIANGLDLAGVIGFKFGGADPADYGWKTDFNTYTAAAGPKHFRIPLGKAYGATQLSGPYSHLIFHTPETTSNGIGPSQAYFSNLRIYESTGASAVNTAVHEYDASGRLETSTDALGRPTQYKYDNNGRLTKTTFADGTFTEHKYDAIGNCIEITDELGHTTRFVYDNRNRLIQTIFADDSSTRTRYDGAGRVTASVDELGNTTDLIDEIGHTSEFTYDKSGRLLATERTLEYNGLLSPVTEEYVYDSLGRLISMVGANGAKTSYAYDPLGRVVETRVHDISNPNLAPTALTRTTYNVNGQIESQTTYETTKAGVPIDFRNFQIQSYIGNEATYPSIVEGNGRSLQVTGKSKVAIELNFNVTAKTVLEFDRNPTMATPQGIAVGNSLTNPPARGFTISPLSSESIEPWISDYSRGNSNKPSFKILLGKHLAPGNYKYLIFTNSSSDANALALFSNVRIYDSNVDDINFETTSINSFVNSGSGTATVTDGGRRLAYTGDTNKAVPVNYQVTPNTVIEFDFKAQTWGGGARGFALAHDLTSNPMIAKIYAHPELSDFPAENFIPQFLGAFNFLAGRIHYRVPIGQYIESGLYEYLAFINDNTTGDSEFSDVRLYESASPDHEQQSAVEFSQTVTTKYDAFGRPVETTNADGKTTSTIYDAAGRVRYTFDELGRKSELKYDAFGRLERSIAPDPDGPGTAEALRTRYVRDAYGNVREEWQYFGQYEGLSNIEHRNQYFYDQRNRVVKTLEKDEDHDTVVQFDEAGRAIATTDALGNTSYSELDKRGRAVEERLSDPDGGGSQIVPVTRSTYDAVGNRTAITDPLGNTTTFEYDSLNRLRKESRNETIIADDSNVADDVEFNVTAGKLYLSNSSGVSGDVTEVTVPSAAALPEEATWKFTNLAEGKYRVSIPSKSRLSSSGNTVIYILDQPQGAPPIVPSTTIGVQKTSPDFDTVEGGANIGWHWVRTNSGGVAEFTVTAQHVASATGNEGVTRYVRLALGTAHAGQWFTADAVRLDGVVSESYRYDNNGNLTKQYDTRGYRTDYTYDALNRQTSVTVDPDRVVNPETDTVLSNGTLPALITTSTYDGYGNLVKAIDNRGTGGTADDRVNIYEYDNRNRLTKETINSTGPAADQLVTQYEYDDVGNRTLVTDPLEFKTSYRYDNLDRVIDEYDDFGQGRPADAMTFNESSLFMQQGFTGTADVSPGPSNGSTLTLSGNAYVFAPITPFQADFRTVLEFELKIDKQADRIAIGFDNNQIFDYPGGEKRMFELGGRKGFNGFFCPEFRENPPLGQTVRVHIPIGQYLIGAEKNGFSISQLVFFAYTDSTVEPADASQVVFSEVRLYESDEVRTVTSYDTRGNVETVRTASDPRNITTSYNYNLVGERTGEVYDEDGQFEREYTYVYDDAGNVTEERNDSADTKTVHEYDRLNRVIKTTLPDPDGNTATPNGLVTQFVYDAVGNLIRETQDATAPGQPTKFITTRIAYDAQGRVVSEWDGNSDETRYRYDSAGNLTSLIDAEQNVTRYTYDGMNRQTSETITALVGSTPTDLARYHEYLFDANGNKFVRYYTRDNRKIHYTYDKLDRLVKEEWFSTPHPTTGIRNQERSITVEYDKLGRVTRQIDSGGNLGALQDDVVSAYKYDGLGRLVEETNYNPDNPSQGSGPPGTATPPLNIPNIKFTYDYGFVPSGTSFAAQLDRTEFDQVAGTEIGATSFQYDRLDRLAELGDFDGDNFAGPAVAWKHLAFRYNTAGDLTLIKHFANFVTGTGWTDQFDTTLDYDKASRVSSIEHDVDLTGSYGDIVHYYTYDNASRVNTFDTTGTVSADRGYTYDNAGQLTNQSGGFDGASFEYDDNGNRILRGSYNYTSPIHTIGPANRLTNDGGYSYSYDKEGNVTRRTPLADISALNPVVVYGYDHRNRLVAVRKYASPTDADANNGAGQNSIQNIDYVYDLDGRRVKRTHDINGAVPGGVSNESFVYDGDDLALRFGNAQELTHRYQYGPAVDQVLADEVFAAGSGSQRVSDEVLWQLADQQGTVRDVVDDTVVLRKHTNFDPFGQMKGEAFYAKNGASISAPHAEAIEQHFNFQGREWDNDARLQQNRARWYDPFTGRFLSEDPVEAANLYPYAGNDPINGTDPTGAVQAGNPLDNLFGGYRAGPVQPYVPISTALSAGSVPIPTSLLNQPSLFGNSATAPLRPASTGTSLGTVANILGNAAYNGVSNYVAQSARTAASAGVAFAAGLVTMPPPVQAPPPQSSLFGRIGNAFSEFNKKAFNAVLSGLRTGEDAVRETTAGTRIVANDLTYEARNGGGAFGRMIAATLNSGVAHSTRFVENTISEFNVPIRVEEAMRAYQSQGIDPSLSLVLAASGRAPVFNQFMTLNELASGQGNRPENLNQVLTRGEQFQNLQGLVTNVQFAGLGAALGGPILREQGRNAFGQFVAVTPGDLPPGFFRQQRVQQKLIGRFGAEAVQPERYLRTASGRIAIDPLTGEGRRVDIAIIRNGQAVGTVEVTSKTASKGSQTAKEERIRNSGGTFILDRSTGNLIDFSNAPQKISRRK